MGTRKLVQVRPMVRDEWVTLAFIVLESAAGSLGVTLKKERIHVGITVSPARVTVMVTMTIWIKVQMGVLASRMVMMIGKLGTTND